MPTDLRWRIDEMQTRFELEPSLNDVFVEGEFDRDVISRCMNADSSKRVIYEIDSVEVPDALLASHHLTRGNKQRVIALARELGKIDSDCAYRCIVDRDLDHWFGELEKTRRLIWTDHCTVELYFFQDDLLHDILIATAKVKIHDWKRYSESLTRALKDMYALRLADRQLDLKLNWIQSAKCFAKQDDEILFDRAEYISRLLNANGKSNRSNAYTKAVSLWDAKLTGDVRAHIRGHDLVELLSWTVGKFGGIKEFSSTVAIERLFVLLSPRATSLRNLFSK